MKLSEALEVKKAIYTGTRPDYNIHDPQPTMLIIDKDYNVDGNGKSVLAFNLNYLDNMPDGEKQSLISKVNKVDNKILGIGPIKAWLKSIFSTGDYKNLSKKEKIKRYKEITRKFPELKKIIRRYKYTGIQGDIK
jgi:hypothetical protein